jgi:hypothetical protein
MYDSLSEFIEQNQSELTFQELQSDKMSQYIE